MKKSMQERWERFKESKFYQKLSELRGNRAALLSAGVIVLALTVILAVSVASNRKKKVVLDNSGTPTVTVEKKAEEKPITDNKKQEQSQPTVVDDSVPELMLPTSVGYLGKAYSADVQVFSNTMQDYRTHLGLDITTVSGAPVFAAAKGRISQIWEDPLMGQCVAISHSGDSYTVYKNLGKDLAAGIEVGSQVVAGQQIGTVGDTAMMELADEPHLHLEMSVKGEQVNPMEYFGQSAANSLNQDGSFEDKGN